MNSNVELEFAAILDAPSQYPEFERKPRAQREQDLRDWFDKYGEVNKCYNLYGMDRADAQPCDDWLDLGVFGKERWLVNSHYVPAESTLVHDHTIFTRTKLTFEMFVSYWYGADSGKYQPSRGVLVNRDFFLRDEHGPLRMVPGDFCDFIRSHEDGHRLVFKQVYGDKGRQVSIVTIQQGCVIDGEKRYTAEEYANEIMEPHCTWVIQDYLFQHPTMAAFNPTSLNTLRIVTYHTGEQAVLGDVAVRMGCPGALVDNAYSDGFYTNVLPNGKLIDSLFNYTAKSRLAHEFTDVVIPFYNEAVALTLDLHSHIPELFTIGWDIAITEQGPVVIEANDGWAVFVTQTGFGHAGRVDYNRYLAERRAFEAAIAK